MSARRRIARLLSPGDGPPFREIVRERGWYPLVVLTSLNMVDELDRAAFSVFAPNIRRYFDVNNTAIGGIVGAYVALQILAAVPIGYYATRHDRTRVLRWSAAVWSTVSMLTAFAVAFPLFVLSRLGVGVGKASVEPVGRSLLADTYPPNGWNRVFAMHNAANPAGLVLGPLFAGAVALAVGGDGAWRVAFPLLAIPSVLALIASRKLREPDNEAAKGYLAATMSVTGAPVGEGFRSSVKQLLAIPTFRTQLVGIGVLGFGLVGLLAFGSVYFEEVHGVGEGGRGVIFAILATGSLAGTLIGGSVGERIFLASPARAIRLVGSSIAAFSVAISLSGALPWLTVAVVVLWFALAALAIATAPLYSVLAAITPPLLRPLMFSLLGLCIALFGGVFGGVLVGAIADIAGIRAALGSLAPFGVVGGLIMRRASSTVDADIAAAGGAGLPGFSPTA